jgi:hypothetical protein
LTGVIPLRILFALQNLLIRRICDLELRVRSLQVDHTATIGPANAIARGISAFARGREADGIRLELAGELGGRVGGCEVDDAVKGRGEGDVYAACSGGQSLLRSRATRRLTVGGFGS